MMATGMLIQKIDRHVHWVRNPPAIGPIAVSPPEMPKKIAIAFPRSRSGNEATTIATAAGNSSAAVAPWTTRKKMIQVSAIAPFGVRPQAAEAMREAGHADQHHAPAPEHVAELSPEREQRRERKQVAVDHPLRPGRGERQLLWIFGMAIATIVWSMNVIATANTIAASTRFLLLAPARIRAELTSVILAHRATRAQGHQASGETRECHITPRPGAGAPAGRPSIPRPRPTRRA